MQYLTQAGLEFLKEDDDSRRRQQRPIPGRRSSEERYTPKGKSIPNQSKDYAGHEERMQAHLDRIAAKERLDRKMGRDVNEDLEGSRPKFRKFLRDLGDRRRTEKAAKLKRKIPQNLKGKALDDALRQADIEGLGFRGPKGQG